MKDQIKTISDLYEEGKDCLNNIPIHVLEEYDRKSHARMFEILRELRDIAAPLAKQTDDLGAWKKSMLKLWGPVIDFAQEKQLPGLRLGESISDYVLELLKREHQKHIETAG